ncbi:hypothetical protein BS412_12470 [Cronobacter turicensis]|uniref:Uncharacterized protein n=1 Tax=Cronobacter turicensis TaxID=413502 RepID=A0A2T7AVY6_9ENTR|nr:hypothetical protein BS411_21530 [Cronobacter turicensis]PUX34281.1 hypothetical protein BS412_12470 [Cronobacter turicensis]
MARGVLTWQLAGALRLPTLHAQIPIGLVGALRLPTLHAKLPIGLVGALRLPTLQKHNPRRAGKRMRTRHHPRR